MKFISTTIDKAKSLWQYFTVGVWREPHNSLKVRFVKTINLSVRAFTNRNLQSQAMALTYTTVLAVVPALALLVAIARGFGLQELIMDELYQFFPSQHKAIQTSMTFVDHYLTQSTQGIFVGVGIIVLLWTLISLLSTIDTTFNRIWGIKQTRSMFQQFIDYIALCLIVPLLMMCSAGVTIFISTAVQSTLDLPFLTPFVNWCLEGVPLLLAWLAFTFSYFLIPNTKVKFKYAAISGACAAIGFAILQALFVNGQIYVSKYNAIYGSFAFLPLLLIWLQLSWLLLLSGCVLTSSMQNVMAYDFHGDISDVSPRYMRLIAVAVMTIIVHRFIKKEKPLTRSELSSLYNLPSSIVADIVEKLHNTGMLYYVELNNHESGLTPAMEVDSLTVADLLMHIDTTGDEGFIPYFHAIFSPMIEELHKAHVDIGVDSIGHLLVRNLSVPEPATVRSIIENPNISAFTSGVKDLRNACIH